jgi:hypothetical protein
MWSAEITDKTIDKGVLTLTITYSNDEGIDPIIQTINFVSKPNDFYLENLIQSRIDQLTSIYEYAETVTKGSVDLSVLVKMPPISTVIPS